MQTAQVGFYPEGRPAGLTHASHRGRRNSYQLVLPTRGIVLVGSDRYDGVTPVTFSAQQVKCIVSIELQTTINAKETSQI
jgi:hypothetical protein